MTTFEEFKQIPPGQVVRIVITEHEKVQFGKLGSLMFVVKKGYGRDDWCIYYHLEERGLDYIKRQGDKLTSKQAIMDIFPCDEETFNRYRF